MLRLSVLLAAALTAGCARSQPPETAQPPSEGASYTRPREPAPDDAIGVGELWNAYLDDAAGAEKKYGGGVLIKFAVDSIDRTPSGFTVTRSTAEGVRHRLTFPKSAASRLEGATGHVMTARGRVVSSSPRGLLIHCE
jgi:hypothetical protein